MPKIDSPFWDFEIGVCKKHMLPEVPCPACIADKDRDIHFLLTEIERSGLIEIQVPKGFESHEII
jgi:hypothetical protein